MTTGDECAFWQFADPNWSNVPSTLTGTRCRFYAASKVFGLAPQALKQLEILK
jgi:hypothetical protein